MAASPETRRRLDGLRVELAHEFPHVAATRIDRLVEVAFAQLHEHARFEDFVPLLVHRRVREQLLAAEDALLADGGR